MKRILNVAVIAFLLLGIFGPSGLARSAQPQRKSFDVVLSAQGEYLDAYFANGSGGFVKKVLVAPDDPRHGGRHLNGKVCFFPRNAPAFFRNKFVVADDTYRESCIDGHQARCRIKNKKSRAYVGIDPDGWGVFNRDATWAHRVIAAGTPKNRDARGSADPQACGFDDKANLIGNDVGAGNAGEATGSILMFFASSGYTKHCFLAMNLAQPGQFVIDNGVIYVPLSGGGTIMKLSPPFPKNPADCAPKAQPEGDTISVPDAAHTPIVETLVVPGAFTPISLVRRPSVLGTFGTPPSWFVASVLITPTILEIIETPGSTSLGIPVRTIVPPFVPRNPIGMDIASDGSALFYAELNLTVPDLGTGCGRVSMVRFDPPAGHGVPVAQPPVVVRDNLQFPDGITVLDSSRFKVDFRKLPDAPNFTPANCGGSG